MDWSWSQTVENGHFSLVQLPWSDFLRNSIYKAFGLLTRCKLNVDQEEWPCTQKWTCYFFSYMSQKGSFAIYEKKRKEKTSLTILLSSMISIFSSSKKNSLKICYNNIFCHGPLFFFLTKAPFWPLPLQDLLDHVSG